MPVEQWSETVVVARVGSEPQFSETHDKEPNDTVENAVEAKLPAILIGTISKPGDVDYFKVNDPDYWLGGVHITPQNVWRWDADRREIIPNRSAAS